IAATQSSEEIVEEQIHPGQFLLAFDLAGRQYVGERLSPAGIYQSARFDIRQLSGTLDPQALGPYFTSLFGGSADKTVVIKGIAYKGESAGAITYISHVSGEGRVVFSSPLAVHQGVNRITVIDKF